MQFRSHIRKLKNKIVESGIRHLICNLFSLICREFIIICIRVGSHCYIYLRELDLVNKGMFTLFPGYISLLN